jgi:drug/metabolite transporter (DMT)-like permease
MRPSPLSRSLTPSKLSNITVPKDVSPLPTAEHDNTRTIISSSVLTVSLLLQSHVQERLNREPFFRAHSSSVLSLCVPLAALLAGVARNGVAGCFGRAPRRAPLRSHFVLGLLLWGSFFLSAVGPLHLPMPIFLAAKSVKILPTMVIAALWLRKRFRTADWIAAFLSALGLILCLTGGSGGDAARGSVAAALRREHYVPSTFGIAVMLGALTCDGASANAQEAIMSHFGAPAAEIAAYTYGVATAASIVHGLGWGSLREGLATLAGNTPAAIAVAAYALASLGATAATLDLIAHLGASSCMFVSSLAKALVILSSVLLSKSFTTSKKQALGIFLVFAAASLAVFARTSAADWLERAANAALDGGSKNNDTNNNRGEIELMATPSASRIDIDLKWKGVIVAPPPPLPLMTSSSTTGLRRRPGVGTGVQMPVVAEAAVVTTTTPLRIMLARPEYTTTTEHTLSTAANRPNSVLFTLRSESSRALSAVTSAVFGVERPPMRAETLTPPLLRTNSRGGGGGGT